MPRTYPPALKLLNQGRTKPCFLVILPGRPSLIDILPNHRQLRVCDLNHQKAICPRLCVWLPKIADVKAEAVLPKHTKTGAPVRNGQGRIPVVEGYQHTQGGNSIRTIQILLNICHCSAVSSRLSRDGLQCKARTTTSLAWNQCGRDGVCIHLPSNIPSNTRLATRLETSNNMRTMRNCSKPWGERRNPYILRLHSSLLRQATRSQTKRQQSRRAQTPQCKSRRPPTRPSRSTPARRTRTAASGC